MKTPGLLCAAIGSHEELTADHRRSFDRGSLLLSVRVLNRMSGSTTGFWTLEGVTCGGLKENVCGHVGSVLGNRLSSGIHYGPPFGILYFILFPCVYIYICIPI